MIKTAWRTLRIKRSRTILTVLGIAVGVMMVSLTAVLGGGGSYIIERELDSMGMNGVSITGGDETLTEETLAAVRAQAGVTSAMPLMVNHAQVHSPRISRQAVLCGIDSGADQVIALTLNYGRLITAGDVAAAAPVCVVDEAVAQEAYGRKNIVGKPLQVSVGGQTATLTVVGVTETGSSLLQNVTALIPGMVYLPYTAAQDLTGQQTFDQIAVRTVAGRDTHVQNRLQRALSRFTEGGTTFRIDNLATQKERLGTVVSVVTLLLTLLSGISLLVSGISIMTVMLSSVSERTREIGIKKAVGAKKSRILLEFLCESMTVSFLGGAVGLVPALILCGLFAAGGIAVGGQLVTMLLLLGFSVLVGCVFGVYPAYKAASLPPVEALRSE